MDSLYKRLLKINSLIKAIAPKIKQIQATPSIKMPNAAPKTPKIGMTPKMPSMKPTNTAPKIPGMTPASTKDPTKVAQQLKNQTPKASSMDMVKFEDNGQWSLIKKKDDSTTVKLETTPTSLASHNTINPKIHGWGFGHSSPDQDKLMHGVKMTGGKPLGEGVASAVKTTSSSHSHPLILKNASMHPDRELRGHNDLTSAHREVLYHNMARDFFGMGKHVPTTSGFQHEGHHYSVQKAVPNASHVTVENGGIANPKHGRLIGKMHDSGDLHKLALMDNIMGHHDRHRHNYLVDNKGENLHLIDNGTAFDYKNFDVSNTSHFHRLSKGNNKHIGNKDDSKLHPEALKWLNGLDEKKASELFANHSYAQDADHVKGFQTRLKSIKEAANKGEYKDVTELLTNNRLSTGPLYNHDKEAA